MVVPSVAPPTLVPKCLPRSTWRPGEERRARRPSHRAPPTLVPKTPHGSTWRPGEGASPQPTSAVKARKGAQAREARPCPGFSQLSVRGYVGEGEAPLPLPARPMLPLPHQPLKLLYQFPKIPQRRIHRCRRRHVHASPAQKLDGRLGAAARQESQVIGHGRGAFVEDAL